ncbi:leucine-rich repeat protein, partial [bacterium]|nr:leucine-rich repeat protein [bacterium]
MNISPPNILRLATSRLLVLVTLFACAFLPVHAASLDDLGYTTTDGKVTITDCDEAATGELVIPPTIEGNPVTSIGDGAFGNCFTLTNITLPDSVVSIGDYAIAGCFSLASITIGDGVISIGESAFRGSRLKSITIPNSVTSIGNQAFTQCFSLASITIGSGVTSIGNSAFRDCTSLTSITFLGTAPEADSSFSNVADGAVAYVNSEALSSFSENGDNWNGLILESRNPNETSLTWSTDNGEVTITNCDEAAGGELVIPSTIEGKPVTSIGERAFEDCIRLTSISLGSGITSIGERAFSNCSQLRSINIPAGVTAIKYYTFLYCTKLNSVSFEANSELSSIGINAFQNCESLRSITIPDGVIEIRDVAFQNCHSLTTIALPNLITSIEFGTFARCRSLTSITIPSGVTSIGGRAFTGCTSLTSVTIPDGVTSINPSTFEGCSSLTNITIPTSVTTIGSGAFCRCASLTSIKLPDGLTSIGNNPFDGTNISYDYIDDSLNYLVSRSGQIAYLIDGSNASGSVNIPISVGGASIALIADWAFDECINLTSITIPDKVSIGDYAFLDCINLTSIKLPDGLTSIGIRSFQGCTSLPSITIPESVTSIENGAFLACIALTDITVPDSVTSIGDYAFLDCINLTNITIGNSVTSIGEYAFDRCTSLTKVTFLGTAPEADTSFNNVADGAVAYVKPEALSSFGELGDDWNNLILDTTIIYTTTDGKVTITDCSETAAGELVIPDTIEGNPVISIGDNAFGDCENLTSITIPESVTSIGIRAFWSCTSLTSITIPESVTSIEDNAFAFCSKLTSVKIPEGVTLLGRGAFIRCSSLINISVDEGNINYSSIEGVLFTKSQNNLLFFPSGREGVYSIPDGVTSINSFSFDSCLLSEVIIPEGVTSIGLKAFQYSSQLTSIVIPEGVASIEPETFRGSTKLVSVTLPSSVTAIGTKAFSMCSNLMEVVLEGPAPEVQSGAFTSVEDGAKAFAIPEHIESYGGDGASWEGLTVREISPPVLNLKNYYESLPDETVSIDATAIDGITDNYDYQWVFNGFPIPENLGGTAAVQVINGIDASEGKWKVVVTNRFGKTEHSFDYRILVDTDEDGLSDGYEELVAGTNPELSDTDEDGLS